MGNVYAVQIGKNSRRGTFLPEITRFVETDETSDYKVRDHFADLYVGFDVKASKVEKVEVLKAEPKQTGSFEDDSEFSEPKKTIVERINYLTNLETKIPDDLKELYDEAKQLRGEFLSCDMKLRDAIASKYSKKEWLNSISYSNVKIDYEYGNGRAKVESVPLKFTFIKEKTVEIE